jgi:tRNA dimethylallyltransferase
LRAFIFWQHSISFVSRSIVIDRAWIKFLYFAKSEKELIELKVEVRIYHFFFLFHLLMDKLPIIVVIGTTGVGKTKLAIQIANKIKGQIVNADSMQVYKGLDIITNKPTENEKGKIKHLLFDFVDPIKEYSVVDYLKDAVKTITQIHKENCIPIIVGGTNYYIQSLLWENITIEGSQNCTISSKYTGLESCHKSLLNKTELIKRLSHLLDGTNPIQHSVLEINEFITNNDLHSSLFEIDPIMAERWHINDYRKIRRSIEIYYTTGKCHSEFLKSQKETVSKLRYRPLVFWLYGSTVELNKRLDSRVDKMISQGLFKEMSDFHKFMRNGTNVVAGNKNNIPDYTRGILQSIGS